MKQQFIKSVKIYTKDRYLTILLGGFFLLCLMAVAYLLFTIRPSELQIVVHYTSFGPTNFYRDKWYYLLSFVGFVLVMAVIHAVISYQILQKRGRELAIAFLWLSVIILLVALALFYQVLKIASLS